MDNGSLQAHLEKLRKAYRNRLEVMDEALHANFSGIARWARPDGGYFFWLQFDDSVNITALIDVAHELEAGFQCGTVFSSKGQLDNYLRLSFAHYNEDDIRLGIRRLKALF